MAAFFLEKAPGRRLNDIALMKLLYIAERESMRRYTATISGSRFSSMKHGPVLSDAYRNLRGEIPSLEFSEHIRFLEFKGGQVKENTFELTAPLEPAELLSRAEIQILEGVWKEFGKRGKWELRDLTHEFPEWDRSVVESNSSKPIPIEEIFREWCKEKPELARKKAEDIEYYEALDS